MSDNIAVTRLSKIPARFIVADILEARYQQTPGAKLQRPLSWDSRVAGTDVVTTETGELLKLVSSGQQPVPEVGWKLLITGGDPEAGYTWTLYGMPASKAA